MRRAAFEQREQGHVVAHARRLECGVHAAQPFLDQPAVVDVRQHRGGAARQGVGRPGVERPLPGQAEVLLVGVERTQGVALTGLGRGLALHQAVLEVRAVCVARGAMLSVVQLVRGQLLHQGVQGQARAVLAQQRLVGQCAQHRQRRCGDGARGFHLEAAAKHRQPCQGVALGRHQSLPRLLEHQLHAGVSRRVRGPVCPQQLGAGAQLGRDRRARQHARPGRRQFERQRQAIELSTDVDDGGRLGGGCERGLDPVRCGDEQARGVERLKPVGVFRLGAGQAFERVQLLAGQAQAHARGDQQPDARAAGQQHVELRGLVHQLLEVVEHQQRRTLAQGCDQLIQRRRAALQHQAEFACDARGHVLHRQQVFERHEGRVVAMRWRQVVQHAARQAGLAHAARARQADQAHVVARQQLGDVSPLACAADETDQARVRQRRGRCGAGRAQAVMQRLKLCAGGEAQLGGHAGGELAVGLARARRLPAVGQPFHQGAQGRLVERVGLQQA